MYRLNLPLLCVGLLSLICTTGCTISHSACDSANGPLMFGGPCGNCTGCGELYVDPWINHPPTKNCEDCDGSRTSNCKSCRPLKAGIKAIMGLHCGAACDSMLASGEVSCGLEHRHSCDGCESCVPQEPTCGIPEISCGIEEATCGFPSGIIHNQTLKKQMSPVHQAAPPMPQKTVPTRAPTIQKPSTTTQKYPMDTPRIYRNRAVSHRST